MTWGMGMFRPSILREIWEGFGFLGTVLCARQIGPPASLFENKNCLKPPPS